MLGDDLRQLACTQGSQALCADAGVILVDLKALGEAWSNPKQQPEQRREAGFQKNRQAAVDHGETRRALAGIMEERCLLEEGGWGPLQTRHRVEDVQTVTLIIDGEPEKERRQRRSKNFFGPPPIIGGDRRGGVPPELADTMQRPGRPHSPSIRGKPQRSFRWRTSKKLRPPSNWTS